MSALRFGSAWRSSIASHFPRSAVTLSKNPLSFFSATSSSSRLSAGRAEPWAAQAVGARRPSTSARSSIWATRPSSGRNSE